MAVVKLKRMDHFLRLLTMAVCLASTGLAYAEFHIPDDEWESYVNNAKNVDGYDVIEPSVLRHNRYKRSSKPEFSSSIKFTAFGEDFHVDLFQSPRFFGPDLKASFIHPDNSVEEIPLNVSSDCFFHGFVPTHNFSRAAVSMCDESRIYGHIDHGPNGIFISPLNDQHSREFSRRKRSAGQGHLIYKRAVEGGGMCPVEPPMDVHQDAEELEAMILAQSTDRFVPEKFLEVVLILDADLVAARGAADSIPYGTALMHIVSRRFAEPSLDVSLRIFLVEIIMLSSDTQTVKGVPFIVTADADATLFALRDWSTAAVPPDGDPGRWDNVVLVSNKDIFTANAGNSIIGLAFTAGTCIDGRGASVNQDGGIAGALTIAHEIGHTMTLAHDQDYGCESGYVMSAFLGTGPNIFSWTPCSSMNIRRFLSEDRRSSCMDNVPEGIDALPVLVLPGQTYDYDTQCALVGASTGCAVLGEADFCAGLQCDAGGGCFRHTHYSPAEGTACAADSICLGGNCVLADSVPEPINGMWSEWGGWTECSRTCDCGVTIRQRLCDDPKPRWGGDFCPGKGIEETLCNTDVSCGSVPDIYRHEQCEATNSDPFVGELYSWFSFFRRSSIPVSFYCRNPCFSLEAGFALRPPENVDGTECWDHDMSTWNMLYKCVQGSCQTFGCDGIADSEVGYDVCRICDGDGSTCTLTSGSFSSGTLSTFNEVVTIPTGATSLLIVNADLANGNHVAVSGLASSYDFFRGSGGTPSEFERSWDTTMTIFREREGNQEIFFTPGPTIEDLLIEFYLSSAVTNSLTYEYYTSTVSYTWNIGGAFGPCSCDDEAIERRDVTCVRVDTQAQVDNFLCTGVKPAATQPCPTPGECGGTWDTGDFGGCSTPCNGGTRTRDVVCQLDGTEVHDSFCPGERPIDSQECNMDPCVEPCCEYIHAPSGTVSRIEGTEGSTCVLILVADIGYTFEFSNQMSSLSGSEFMTIENRAGGTERSSPIAYNVREVTYRLDGGSFQFDYSTLKAASEVGKCDDFIDTTSPEGLTTGTITSPRTGRGTNKNYPPNAVCWTRLLAEKDHTVTLFFRRLKLQASIRRGCQYDRLEVRNLVTGKRDMFCGKMNRFTLIMGYDTVLYFKTNWRKQFRGFLIEYTVN